MKFNSLIANESGNLLHHAYLIEGDMEIVLKELFIFFEQSLDITVQGNPDFLHLTFDSFGIDEGRKIKEMQAGKAFIGERRLFVISASVVTHEAQHSLLKVFEDPSPHVHFFIIIPTADGLLPTLRSRFFIIEHESKYKTKKTPAEKTISAREFLENTSASRFAMIKGIVEDKNKDKALTLLNDIEVTLHIKLVESVKNSSRTGSRQVAVVLEEIGRIKQYLHDRSSSVKVTLEHIALVLPLIK